MIVEKKNGRLLISLPLRRPKLSSSGKTRLVATSRGVKDSGLKIAGMPLLVTANAFIDLKDAD
jgi:hypothetical protein